MLSEFFTALYSPYLETVGYEEISFYPDDSDYPYVVYLDGEPHEALSVAPKLHGSPILRDVTGHISQHTYAFLAEITAQQEANRRVEEEED